MIYMMKQILTKAGANLIAEPGDFGAVTAFLSKHMTNIMFVSRQFAISCGVRFY